MNEICSIGIDGITMTKETGTSRIKTQPTVTLSNTILTQTTQELNTGLCSQKPMTNHINYGNLTIPKGKHRERSWV